MNKQAHILFIILDLCCLWGLWIGYSTFHRIPLEISNQVDVIEFGNRKGFFTISFAFPLFHIIALVNHYWTDFTKKYATVLNTSVYAMIAVLIVAGFFCSSWLESQVENSGYIYCRRASGVSAISKVLVYTKDMKICEDLIEKKLKRRRTGKW